MSQAIPFFELFTGLELPWELRKTLDSACLTDVELNRKERRIAMSLTVPQSLEEEGRKQLEDVLTQFYSLSGVKLRETVIAPKETTHADTVIFGAAIKGEAIAISGLNPKMNSVVVTGRVFAADLYETRRSGVYCLSFEMTDYSSSVRAVKYLEQGEKDQLKKNISSGMWLKVQGRVKLGRDGSDIVLEPKNIVQISHAIRQDTAPVKRVELHMHTTFSSMDALSSLNPKAGPDSNIIKRAEYWGHPAIAITDHGVAQGFPDAWHSAKSIKLLYGMEGYFLNNVDSRLAVYGDEEFFFEDEYVAFDIETTGLNAREDAITEIGAAVIHNGEVGERFQTFVQPGRHLSAKIISLTGITDEMLAGAPEPGEALRSFLKFAGNRPLVAHNAPFDISFIREGCQKEGIPFHPTYVDTLVLAQNLLPDMPKHKLDMVAVELHLPPFQHHRASDDAITCGLFLPHFFQMLKKEGVSSLGGINPAMQGMKREVNGRPQHIILIAQNKTGLKNLYQLISASNLKYFKRVPIVPKDELIAHREGLIIGSACESGELFQAVLDNRDWAELRRIAGFYDFLEIQPVCNNAFLIRDGRVKDWETLRELNRIIVRLGDELHKPVCATGDVHFLDPEDEIYRHILLDSKQFKDCDEQLPLYFKTTNEMLEEFAYLGEEKALEVVVTNPRAIAEQVERFDLLPKGKLFPPRLENSREDLNRLVWEKVHKLYGQEPPSLIVDRLNVELGGILGKYDVVYMSAQKLVQRSLENGYLVGSRGSVGSSLAAYMSGITEVNSLPPHYRCPKCQNSEFILDNSYGCGADMPDKLCPKCGTKYEKDGFDIPFETFLGFGGGKVPDIDLNFSGEYQARAHRHAIEMFGETQVFRAGTIGTVAEKTAYGYVKKYLEARGLTPGRAEENRLAQGCVGVKRTTGQHPGGLVVVPDDLDMEDFCPVQHPADAAGSDVVTTHFEYHCMEDNLLKLDMLGHDDPTMVRMLEDLTGVNPRTIPLDDPKTMSLFTTSRELGFENDEILGPTGAVAIPEFNTKFTRQMLVDTKPKDFNTLVRLSGFSHGTDVWLGNARELIVSGTASVLETVGCRDDIMLYLISKGIEPKLSFQIMEAVRKGKVKKEGFKEGWKEAMEEHDVPAWYIESLAKIGYLFPKAHAVAYVMMAFRIAWFKVHRPLAFYAAFFSIRAKAFDAEYCCAGFDAVKKKLLEIWNNKDAAAVEQDLAVTLEVCYEFYLRGFRFETINIYKSEATRFVISGEDALIPPFTAVRGLGEMAALDTVEKRKGQEFISIEEFALCCNKLSKTHIEQLRNLGAFAGLPETSQLSLF